MRCCTIATLTGLVASGASVSSCGPRCVEVDLTCQELYPPTFDNVFDNTLLPKCGTEGSTCHSVDGHKAGLVLAEIDQAYDELLGQTGDAARVIGGDANCSEMIFRIFTDDPDDLMPPGEPLSAGERCSLAKWVANGAER
jgi:hypothetical protein